MIPEHLKYTPTHEWFFIEKKSITVGLTSFIIDKLDKLLYLDIPKEGDEILSGICFGEIESFEMLVDITSPISGKIIASNARLIENLDLLSNDPYNKGWLIKFIVTEPYHDNELLSAQEYGKLIAKLQPSAPQKRKRPHAGSMKRNQRK